MKNLITITGVVFICLTATAQTTVLEKMVTINDENIENVSLNGNELVFNTSSNLYSYECGGNLNEDENSDINDIYNGEALTGDTIGKSNFNNGTYLLSTPYNEVYPLYITDGVGANPYFTFNYDLLNNEYIIKDFNGDYIIVGYNLYLDLLTDFDYFDNQVIMSSTSTAGPFSYGQNGMLIYDFSNPIPYFVKAEYDYNGSTWLIENSITSTTIYNNTIYFSSGNTIYKVINIITDESANLKTLTCEKVYLVPGGINEFEFDYNDYVYVANSNGIYSNNSCPFISLSVEEDNILNDVSLYPNPTKSELNFTGLSANTSYQILNISGKIIQTGITNQTIDVINLENGIYFLHLDGYEIQKFIKQ